MKTRKLVILLSAMLVLPMAACHAAEMQLTTDSLDTVKQKLKEGKAVLVDVREKAEWDEGRIQGAVHLPISELRDGVDPKQLKRVLPKDKILYTHCVSGRRSLAAGRILEQHGFEVRPLEPGYKELVEAGFD